MDKVPLYGHLDNVQELTDFYVYEPNDLADCKTDVNVIADTGYLQYINGVHYEEDKYIPLLASEWYPKCNSYYPYTEDVDPENRVDHIREAKQFLESFTTIKTDSKETFDAFTKEDAHLKFLNSKPATFIILGKPGIGEQKLAKLLAEHWRCVYIDPEILITEEIESGSRSGQCIEFNLRCGRAIAVDVILKLLEKRVRTKSASHRGFVICGFPLIKNDMFLEDPVSSESAVFTVHDIFEEVLDTIGTTTQLVRNVSEISRASVDDEQTLDGDEGVEEDDNVNSVEVSRRPSVVADPAFDIGSTNSQMCKVTSDIGSNYAAQVNFLFGLCHEPLIIIYIMCPNFDVVTKHENIRYNIKTEEFVNLLKDQTENIVYTIYTKNPGFDNEDLPDDMLDIPGTTDGRLSSSDQNYLMYLPGNFSGNVQKQLEDYRYRVLPTIEKHVLLHDPEYFIKVDGRLSSNRMFNIVKTRLRLLPIPSVVLPERLIDIVIPMGGEGDEVETYDYDAKSPEECFDLLKRRKTVGRMFKLKWSKWGSSCPVSMKEGTYYEGKAKYAVKFLDRIFFLSDEEAMIKFIRNPRPYLTPPCPRPTCKIFVIGPPVSGKSAIAKCLALLLDGKVLDSISLQLQYTQQKEKEYLEKVRSDAINEALAYLQEQRQLEYEQKEKQRKKDKDTWIVDSVDFVNERTFLDMQMRVDPVAELTAFPLKAAMSGEIDPEIWEQFQSRMEELEERMNSIGLSILFEDVSLCYELLTEDTDIRKEILRYLPDYLKTPTPFPEPPGIFDSFVTDFIAEKVENRVKLNFDKIDDLVDMFLTAIRETEESNIEAGSYHGGWVVDGMIPEPEILDIIFEEFIPNDIFIFRDSSGGFLQDRYKLKGQNMFMDYCGFFETLGKTDVAMKSPSLTTTYSYKTRFARSIIDDALTIKVHDDDSIAGELEYGGEEPIEFVDEDYFATHATRIAMQEYDKFLKAYEHKMTEVLTYLDDRGIPYSIIDLADKPLEKLMKEVVTQVDSRYQLTAQELTPNDRAEEVDDFGEPAMIGEDMGEEDAGPSDGDVFAKNRRLGMTNVYCPVAYHSYWVLWKGKEEFAAKYDDEIFFMSSEAALRLFTQHPQEYLHTLPPERIPPPRICIVGVQGSGKTFLAQKICRELGLYYVGFDELLKKVVNQEHNTTELRVILDHIPETPEVIMVQNYLDKGDPLPEGLRDLLNLQRLWFQEPIKSTGFVLDGYPRRPPDLQYMESNFLIPDLILELNCDDIEVNRRRVQKLVQDWKMLHDHEHEEREKKYMDDMAEWEGQRKARVEELMEIKRQERYQAKIQELKETPLPPVQEVNEDEEERATARSQVSYNSVAEEADLEEINNIVKTEFPEPVFVEEEETHEDATDRFILYAQQEYAIGLQFFNLIRDCANDVQIDVVPIDADVPLQKVFDQAMRAVDHVKFRNSSILERCYDINVETAERLMSNGYYFLSRFGKMCPVQLYEKDNPFHMFIPLEQKFEIFPVVHRYFIYFLAGKSNRSKFVNNPLKYILQHGVNFPIIPLRLAVIGPPKSGKTSMCERFKRDYGMKHISIGQAVRYVLRYLPFSKLAHDVESVLREGWELTSEMTMRCVEAMAFDGRGITQGMVFDGFPNSRFDVKHLAEIGLVPHLVFYLDADNDDIAEYLSTDKGKRGLPAFNKAFIQHRVDVWNSGVKSFLDWFDKEFQVWTKVPVKTCKWGIWQDVYKVAMDVVFEIKSYYRNCNREMGLLLANMQVTPTEFMKRRSFFKSYCPCCLHYDDRLVGGAHPPDRTGLVQYKDKYYFVCNKHLKEFSDDPPSYLSPYNTKTLPDDLPFIVNLESTPPDCYMDGFCIVCYWDAQPHRLLNPGSFEFACSYKDTIYIFDSRECLMLFMMEPHKYFRKQICFKGGTFASLDMNNLPVQGFLEQYVSRDIIRAVSNCGFTRPVIAGLGIAKSAAINMGLLLKIHNPKLLQDDRDAYVKASDVFKERRLMLINHLAHMKKSINPFLHYEEPLEPLQTGDTHKYESSESDQRSPGGSFASMLQQVLHYMQQPDEASRVPVPDERFDYLCEYFKPLSKVPAFLNVVDIAGLVKGASEGQGLGNAFLSHISACDAIFHLCRVFEDDDVTHVEGDVNPVRDLEIISEELRLKDEEMLIKNLDKLERTAIRGNDKKLKPDYDTMAKAKTVLVDQKQHIRFADWHVNDIEILNKYLFLTSKPMIYLVNLSEKDYIKKKNKWLVKIKEWVDKNDPGAIIIPFSGAFEFRLVEEQDPELRKKIQTDAGATSALDKIIIQGYKALQLEYFFTAGADEVKAWTIAKGTKAPQAAGKIHTDFEKGFIMAEVMKFQDFKEEGSEAATKAAGKYRQQGRNYVVEDGDIIFFKFNAGAGIKDGKKK